MTAPLNARLADSRRRPLAWLLVLLTAAGSTLVAAPTGVAAAATDPYVHTLTPVPGRVVAAGSTLLHAHGWSEATIVDAHLTLDGADVASPTISPQQADQGVEVNATVPVAVGEHVVQADFRDDTGRTWHRSWTFTATDRTATRHAGAGRLKTAVDISQATYPTDHTAAAAVLARADDFADALAGAPLAAAVDGPLLLTSSGALDAVTADELRRVLPAGATVHLLGGRSALNDAVSDAVADLDLEPVRHGGGDRYETAAEVARQLPSPTAVVVANGLRFPDALAASSPAARDGMPVLLTAADHLPAATETVLADLHVATATIVGGTAVVEPAVKDRLTQLGIRQVDRVWGPDRYATAAAVLDRFFDRPTSVSLASGVTFPDALAGTRHAAAGGQPLLLSDPHLLPAATAGALAALAPTHLDVYGGTAALQGVVVDDALHAAIDGPSAPRVTAATPGPGATVAYLDQVTVQLDRSVELATSTLYVAIGGQEVQGTVSQPAADRLTLAVDHRRPLAPLDRSEPASISVVARDGAATGHAETTFTYHEPDPWYASAGNVALQLPSRDVEMIGFHQANHDGAQQQTARDTTTPTMTQPTRDRGTGSRTAADIVSNPDLPVYAPVSGTVKRGGTYTLYCRYTDEYLVIEPDAHPGWEVKLLHFRGLRVAKGQHVVARQTIVGDGPHVLPFHSTIDDYSTRGWPHVHVEVVDPSIPNPGGGGC